MFPQVEENAVNTALQTAPNFEEAVEQLLVANESDEGMSLLWD